MKATRILSICFTALFISLGTIIISSILKLPGAFLIFLLSFASLSIWQSYCDTTRKMWIRAFFILGTESIITPIVLFLTVAARVNSTTSGAKLGTLFAGTVVVGMTAVIGLALGVAFIAAGMVMLRKKHA